MGLRLGEVMVAQGLLTEHQVQQILHHQRHAHRPFGVLAEDLFGISEDEVERAWVAQYASLTRQINPHDEKIDPEALRLVDRRQAWQFRVLPIRFDGDELMIATTPEHLVRALRFASRCVPRPCYFVLTDSRHLGDALVRYFPMAGMTAESVDKPFRVPVAKAG
ncbi:MAG: hypothetical protein ACKVZJ_03920 [Phycisphaerales bacterium]